MNICIIVIVYSIYFYIVHSTYVYVMYVYHVTVSCYCIDIELAGALLFLRLSAH